MKKIFSCASGMLLTAFILSSPSCAKKNETDSNSDCKTCKAFASRNQPEVTEEACSAQAEQAFRSQYAGREISCR